jgi:hypothetical protein
MHSNDALSKQQNNKTKTKTKNAQRKTFSDCGSSDDFDAVSTRRERHLRLNKIGYIWEYIRSDEYH